MKVYCHKCGGIHEKGTCPLSDKTPSVLIPQTPTTPPPKSKRLCEMEEDERIIQQFYNSKQWKKKREEIIERARGLCEVCWALGRIREGREVHHIVKIRTNFKLRLESSNLILVCSTCHHEIEDCCSSIEDLVEYVEQKKKKK